MAITPKLLQLLLGLLGSRNQPPPGTSESELLGILNSALSGRRTTTTALSNRILSLLQDIERVQGSRPSTPRGRDTLPVTSSGWQPRTPPPLTPTAPSRGSPEPSLPPLNTRTKQPQGFPEEQQHFSDEFLAPTSSNVYSFQYFRRPGDPFGILYVTYKANKIRGEIGSGRFKGGKRQLRGKSGRTVGGKVNKPGSTYAYFRVPPSVFTDMKSASSKGGYVWDALRVRHSVWGTRYPYQLVVGQILKTPTGGTTQYVPRKATRRGFATRSVSDTGTGRRGFVSSTLPASSGGGGFTTRRRR